MTDDYPLYISWRRITEYLIELCGSYPRNVRFTLCDRITNISLDVLEAIIEAIYAKQKTDILQSANLYMEKLRALMQISVNKKYISVRQYEHITREINEAGKMLGGWKRSCGG
ncbi:MAG: diversity-generating retroelement protein Avd [Spirochaetales bacterium]|nr:diversity-generating retroelement protein Avd [Spirochaetales bacterium]